MSERVLKRDHFGQIAEVTEPQRRLIRRDTRIAQSGLRWFARRVAAREARALTALDGLTGVPQLLRWHNGVLDRSYLEGQTMADAQPRDVDYFRAARRLLLAMHRRGVAHNDLAKEPNWLVTPAGLPALVDFQLASIGAPRSARMRLLAAQDLRHLLKHKRSYCPERLTPVERRVLARRSWLSRLWRATGKRLYRLITRGILGWEDNEGRGRQRDGSFRS